MLLIRSWFEEDLMHKGLNFVGDIYKSSFTDQLRVVAEDWTMKDKSSIRWVQWRWKYMDMVIVLELTFHPQCIVDMLPKIMLFVHWLLTSLLTFNDVWKPVSLIVLSVFKFNDKKCWLPRKLSTKLFL